VPSGCPNQSPDDVWLNVRLSCFYVGQPFIDISKSATGSPADRAYIVSEQVLDSNFTNVLGSGKQRYFEYILCVKQAPANIASISLASDYVVATWLGSLGSIKGIGAATTSIGQGKDTGPTQVETACDPAIHPVIVDFPSGKIESVNPAALANLKITDS